MVVKNELRDELKKHFQETVIPKQIAMSVEVFTKTLDKMEDNIADKLFEKVKTYVETSRADWSEAVSVAEKLSEGTD